MMIIIHIKYVPSADMNISPEQEKAFKYYKKNSASIEILKDDFLQKVHFRVKNKVMHVYCYDN